MYVRTLLYQVYVVDSFVFDLLNTHLEKFLQGHMQVSKGVNK